MKYPLCPVHSLLNQAAGVFLCSQIMGDKNVDDTVKCNIQKWLKDVLDDYAGKLGAEKELGMVRKKYELLEKGSKHVKWIPVYERLDCFRTSLPGVEVWDVSEKERRGKDYAKYEADLYALITRAADGFRYKEGKSGLDGIIIVPGYGKWHKVWLQGTFGDVDCGIIRSSEDYQEELMK